jgi:PhnB protein
MTSTQNNTNVQPYLFFDGRCGEALEFYAKSIGAMVEALARFKDSPDPSMCMPGIDQNRVMHASFRIGGASVMASDGRCTGQPKFEGFALSLNLSEESEA